MHVVLVYLVLWSIIDLVQWLNYFARYNTPDDTNYKGLQIQYEFYKSATKAYKQNVKLPIL